MPASHRYDPPERFVTGTVGEPGARTFFLQARSGQRITTVVVEKQQAEVLAERMEELLDEVMRVQGGEGSVPALPPAGTDDHDPLEQPIEEEFRVGTMTLSWDGEDERVVVELFPVDADPPAEGPDVEDAEPDEPDQVLVVRLLPGQARAFTQRTVQVVRAGRPPCPFCGEPIDASGHLCVRANGYKRSAGRT